MTFEGPVKPWYDERSMENNPHVTLNHKGSSLEVVVSQSSGTTNTGSNTGSGFLRRSLRAVAPIAFAACLALMSVACDAKATPTPTPTAYEQTIRQLSRLEDTLVDALNQSSYVQSLSQADKELFASGLYSARSYGNKNTDKNATLPKIVAEGSFELRQMQFFKEPGRVLLLYHPDRKEDAHFMFSFAEQMLPLIEKFAATSLKKDPYTIYVGPLTTTSPIGVLAGPSLFAADNIYYPPPIVDQQFLYETILHESVIFNLGIGRASPRLVWLSEGGSEFLGMQILEEILRTSPEWNGLIPFPGATEEERFRYRLTVEERFGYDAEARKEEQEFLAAMEKATGLVYRAKDGMRYVVLSRLQETNDTRDTELINFLISREPLLSKADKGALQAGFAERQGLRFWYDLSKLTGNPTILTDVLRSMPPAPKTFKPGQLPEYMTRPQNELLRDYVLQAVPESQRAAVEAFYNLRVFGVEK